MFAFKLKGKVNMEDKKYNKEMFIPYFLVYCVLPQILTLSLVNFCQSNFICKF